MILHQPLRNRFLCSIESSFDVFLEKEETLRRLSARSLADMSMPWVHNSSNGGI